MPERFYDRVEKGSIILKKASKFIFCKEGIMVDDETAPLERDLVILATGFKGDEKLKDIFVSPAFKDCILTPQLHQFHTIEMRCRWLAELLDSTFKLPSIEMEKDAERWNKHMKQYSSEYPWRSCIGALHIWYNDQLGKDTGVNPKRKKGFFSELFQPYGPMDYRLKS